MTKGTFSAVKTGRDRLAETCTRVLELPLHWQSCLTGQSAAVVLHELTGISKSRIAEGGFDRLRPITMDKARAHNHERTEQEAQKFGWPDSVWQHLQGEAWMLPDGTPAHLARLFAIAGEVDRISLGMTARAALNWEGFAVEILRACQGEQLELGWRLCQDFCAQWAPGGLTDDTDLLPAHQQLNDAGDWDTLAQVVDRVMQLAYVNFFALLDAEWGAQVFKTPRPVPLFLWLAPTIDWESEGLRPKTRNGIRRPVRKLLELTYALACKYYEGAWPPKAPGRSDVAKVLEVFDHHAGNYFDGTRQMRLPAFEAWWEQLCRSKRPMGFTKIDPASPDMLARVALLWQHDLVHTKADVTQHVILLDQGLYRSRWKHHRQGLSVTSVDGAEEWPGWLTASQG